MPRAGRYPMGAATPTGVRKQTGTISLNEGPDGPKQDTPGLPWIFIRSFLMLPTYLEFLQAISIDNLSNISTEYHSLFLMPMQQGLFSISLFTSFQKGIGERKSTRLNSRH